ncbi:MAG TPA: translation initiation factor IF-2 [Gemmataceae bacterium]|jgi:translation initiation factor IF-2
MRVYQLAKTLNVESKELLDYCKELGYDIKNQLSNLAADQCDALMKRAKQGPQGGVAVAAPPPVLHGKLDTRVRTLTPSRSGLRPVPAPEPIPEPAPAPEAAAPPAPPEATPPAPAAPPPVTPTRPTPVPVIPAAQGKPPVLTPQAPRPPVVTPAQPPAARPPVSPPTPAASATTPPPRPTGPTPPPVAPTRPSAHGPLRNLGGGSRPGDGPGGSSPPPTRRPPLIGRSPRSPGYGIVSRAPTATPPPSLRNQQAPKPAAPKGPQKLANIPQHLLERGGPITVKDVMDAHKAPPGGAAVTPPSDAEDEGEGDKGKGKARPGGVAGRDVRRAGRDLRAKERKAVGVQVQGGRVMVVEDERESRLRRGGKIRPKIKRPGTIERKGKVPVTTPITVRGLSEAIGLAAGKVLQKLMGLGVMATINSVLEADTAELIATDAGVELDIRKPQDAEERLAESLKTPDDPAALQPRAPVVTIMGHVDHGKTSLLDKIRHSNVVDTEAGGITQVIRAWRVEYNGKPITFLDTPGHEAFTKMRARGAHVTDIAVIVVAATDGVMPQTEEAINHAKAAGVSIIVAINKIDMPNANVAKTRQQLYGLGVLPDNMGGDVPFVETSAATGQGINDLLEAILLVAELKELKANPDKPARGTCLEAHLRGDEGVFATLLIREGTLHKGDIVLCGASYGRVRQMYNDLGRSVADAGPSIPVRITGLDEVPEADDPFQVVADLSQAREIAEKRRAKRHEAAQAPLSVRTLESLGGIQVTELKVILKADFRGSIEAIRKELEKLQHEEVRARLLHTGIGAITVSDVQLALTSPQDTLVVGFNTTPDDDALRLADERGVTIREYNIIYNLTADIKAALEGKLKPREEVIHLGRAIVRQVFKISRVGTVAGCYVTQGTIERAAKVRVIRGGVVVYPPAERTASLESLKRHKDDAREVKAGMECGIKIAGYDDVKVDDVIEAYRVEQVQRTL